MPILWRMNRSTPLAATAAVVILGLGLPMAQAETRGTTQDDVLAAALLPGWQMDSGAHTVSYTHLTLPTSDLV